MQKLLGSEKFVFDLNDSLASAEVLPETDHCFLEAVVEELRISENLFRTITSSAQDAPGW